MKICFEWAFEGKGKVPENQLKGTSICAGVRFPVKKNLHMSVCVKWISNTEVKRIKPGGTAGKNIVPVPAEVRRWGGIFVFPAKKKDQPQDLISR